MCSYHAIRLRGDSTRLASDSDSTRLDSTRLQPLVIANCLLFVVQAGRVSLLLLLLLQLHFLLSAKNANYKISGKRERERDTLNCDVVSYLGICNWVADSAHARHNGWQQCWDFACLSAATDTAIDTAIDTATDTKIAKSFSLLA